MLRGGWGGGVIVQSCSLLVDDELDEEELVVALWKNKLGAEVTTSTDVFNHVSRGGLK